MDRLNILSRYKNDDKLFAATILDKVLKYQHSKPCVYTNYMSPTLYNIAISILNRLKVPYLVYKDSLERKLIAIGTDSTFDYVRVIKVVNKSSKKLLHKDYMGAIYNIGINENNIGDIYVIDDYALIYVTEQVLDYLLYNLYCVGSSNVEVLEIDKSEVSITQKFREVTFSCSSLRIDLVLAKLYNLSRNDATDVVKKKNVYVNSILINNNSKELRENDVVSVRKYGKFKYIGFSKTKKDKIYVNLEVYE